MSLLEGFSIFDLNTIPIYLSLQPDYNKENDVKVLINHHGSHGVVDGEATKTELRIFNSVVAANPDIKQLIKQQLILHIIKSSESMWFPNLAKLATTLWGNSTQIIQFSWK